jgi:hypothetical protein
MAHAGLIRASRRKHAASERRLSVHGVLFGREVVPQTKRAPLFLHDPAGNGVELIFKSEDAQC